MPAPAFETAVAKIVTEHLQHRADRCEILSAPEIRGADELLARSSALCEVLRSSQGEELAELIASGHLSRSSLRVELNGKVLARHMNVAQNAMASDM